MICDIKMSTKALWHWDRKFKCPQCGGSHFGTSNIDGLLTGFCHDQFGSGCGFQWDRKEDKSVFVLREDLI